MKSVRSHFRLISASLAWKVIKSGSKEDRAEAFRDLQGMAGFEHLAH